jgi:acyl carrier protein
MTNIEKYREAFISTFNLKEIDPSELEYQSINEWDSVGHMGLMAELEDSFDIFLETDDIIDFSSFKKGIDIMKKYDVNIMD